MNKNLWHGIITWDNELVRITSIVAANENEAKRKLNKYVRKHFWKFDKLSWKVSNTNNKENIDSSIQLLEALIKKELG